MQGVATATTKPQGQASGSGNFMYLLVSEEDVMYHINGQVYQAPEAYKIGAIVSSRSWSDDSVMAVRGEAVFVNINTRDVQFLDELDGVRCTVFKGAIDQPPKARIYGNMVKWL